MQPSDDIQYTIALSLLPGIGHITARKILQHSGSAKAFFKDLKSGQFDTSRSRSLKDTSVSDALRQAERELEQAHKFDIRCLPCTDPDFPRRLNACDDGPIVLFTRGQMDLNAPRMIALVGTRKATPYGILATTDLVDQLAQYQCTLVSGLAYGIDTAAHRAARDAGIQNVGVLAHGLDLVYPQANRTLARNMEKFGGLVSDFPTGTKPDRTNFPVRNRIIAGLSDAIVVVEAAEKGGALITADMALSYNREVFAVPGRVNDDFSNGCNRLIRNNRAAILSSAADLPWHLGWKKSETTQTAQANIPPLLLNPDEECLLMLIRQGTNALDPLIRQVDIPVNRITAALLSLEFKGIIKSLPGKSWQLTGSA